MVLFPLPLSERGLFICPLRSAKGVLAGYFLVTLGRWSLGLTGCTGGHTVVKNEK